MTPSPPPQTAEHGSTERHAGARLFGTWIALMALAGLSLVLSFVQLGALQLPIAMIIAGVKAVLVALVFMELGRERTSARFTLVTGAALLATLLGLMVADVLTRTLAPLESRSTSGAHRDER